MWFKNISFQYSQWDLGKAVNTAGFFGISDIRRYRGLNLNLSFLKTCRFCLLHCLYVWSPKTSNAELLKGKLPHNTDVSRVFYCVISSYLYFAEPEMLEAEDSDMFSKEMRFFAAALEEFCPDVMERSTRHPQIPGAISLEQNVSHLCRWGQLLSIWCFSEEAPGQCGAWLLFTTALRRTKLYSWAWVRPAERTTSDSQPRLWARPSWKWIFLLETDHPWGQNLWS